jgi:hypothetical protein
MSLFTRVAEPSVAAPAPAPGVRPAWTIGVFCVTLVVYALFTRQVLLYTNPPTGDQPFYLHTAISIVQDHDIEESNNYQQQDERLYYPQTVSKSGYYPGGFLGILAPFPLPPHNGHTTNRPPNEQYSKHGLGLSVLIVPGWALGVNLRDVPPLINLGELDQSNAGWPVVVYQLNILGALLAAQVFLLAYEVSRRVGVALVVWLALSFSNPVMTYSYLIFPELPAGLCAIYAFRRLALGWNRNGPGRLLLIGLAAGFMPWLHARFLPITLGLAAFAVWSWWRARGGDAPATVVAPETPGAEEPGLPAWRPPTPPAARPARRRSVAALIWPLAPVVISGLLLMGFYDWLYGTILPNTGDHAGFINPITDPAGLPVAMLGLLLDQQWGMLIAAPIYALAFVGLLALWSGRETRTLLLWLVVLIAPYFVLVADYRQWWGEWCPPARYLCTVAPLLAAPLAQSLVTLRRSILYKGAFAALAVVSWAVMAGLLAHPRSFWNHPSGQSDLLLWLNARFHIDLVPRLPAVAEWSFDHQQPMRWDLLASWTGIVVVVVAMGAVLVRENRARPQPMAAPAPAPWSGGPA